MHRIRVYVDTSVFGGVYDDEFSAPSQFFFDRVHRGFFEVLLSAETLRELAEAPNWVKDIWRELPLDSTEEIPLSNEVNELAGAYIEAKVLGKASESDALHVAAATVAGSRLDIKLEFQAYCQF